MLVGKLRKFSGLGAASINLVLRKYLPLIFLDFASRMTMYDWLLATRKNHANNLQVWFLLSLLFSIGISMAIQFEQAKLWLLILCLAVCIVSLFTSVGVDIAIPTLRYIPGSSRRSYCKGIEETLQRSCSLENTSEKNVSSSTWRARNAKRLYRKHIRTSIWLAVPFNYKPRRCVNENGVRNHRKRVPRNVLKYERNFRNASIQR